MAIVTVRQHGKTTSKVVKIETTAYVVVSVTVDGTEATATAWGSKDPTVQVELTMSAGRSDVIVDYICTCAGVIISNGIFSQPRMPGLAEDIEVALGRF